MSAPHSALLVDLAAHRSRARDVATVRRQVDLAGLEMTSSRVREGRVDVDLVLEDVADGMVVTGHLRAVSEAECRRCLDSVTEELDVSVREIFEEHPTEGETWPIEDDHIDLEPMVRAAVMLALPLAPLCRDECRGPVPERFPTGAVPSSPGDEQVTKDPRWAALDELRFDE